MKQFVFAHAGRTHFLAWLRYKAKESWFLARSLYLLTRTDSSIVVVHNSVSAKLNVTRGFVNERADELSLTNTRILKVIGNGPTDLLMLAPAFFLFFLPLSSVEFVARKCLAIRAADLDVVVTFFDGHLSGFILANALRKLDVKTATLQHGLYRCDDVGSRMALANFSSDTVFLWDEHTRDEFIRFGVGTERLFVCGQYGFSQLIQHRERPQNKRLVALCPPYDRSRFGLFFEFADELALSYELKYSIHPVFSSTAAKVCSEPLARMLPRPAVAICGDSAVIMDSLARGIPVISVGSRVLAGTHLFYEDDVPVGKDWEFLVSKANLEYTNDLRTFGFI